MTTIAITGASGFLGRHFASHLIACGHRVIGLIRRTSPHVPLEGVQWVTITGFDDKRVRDALQGVDTLIHLGARVHVLRERDPDPVSAYQRVNVNGTRYIMEAALNAGVSSVLFMSSVSAVGGEGSSRLTDASPLSPRTDYGRSKRDAELIVEEYAAGQNIKAVIFRPPSVYGPGMKGNLLSLFRMIAAHVPIPVPAITNARSLVYVRNLVEAATAAINAGKGGTYFVADDEALSSRALVETIARSLDVRPLLLPVSPRLARAAGRLGDSISRVVETPFVSANFERLFESLTVDTSRLELETGFVPRYSIAEGMAETARWFRNRSASAWGW